MEIEYYREKYFNSIWQHGINRKDDTVRIKFCSFKLIKYDVFALKTSIYILFSVRIFVFKNGFKYFFLYLMIVICLDTVIRFQEAKNNP